MSTKLRNLQAQKAETVKAMRELHDKASAENRDFTTDEQAAFGALEAKATSLTTAISREQALSLEEAGLGNPGASNAQVRGPPANTVVQPAASHITVTENALNDPTRGFRSLGEFAQAVRGAAMTGRTGAAVDQRLGFQAAAPGATFGNEAVGGDGGFLVPPTFGQQVFQLSLEESALLPMTDNMPVEGNSMSLPKDETTPWGSNGVRAYWQNEGVLGQATKPVIGRSELRLKKLMALVPVSDELMADTTALGAYLQPQMARSIRWKTDEAILFGSGAGQPLGCFNAGGAVITVSKESGQATNTLVPQNVAKMIARLMPGSYSKSYWMLNNDVLPALFTMTLGNYPIYMPAGAPVGGIQGSPYGSLLGRPIIVTQHAKSFSSLGDIMLADLSYYQSMTKAEGISIATSMHLYFDADAMAFRATFRVDGQPKIVAPVSPANGSNTLSPFVQLEAR
jgi:HK97 family phage major capsid protein